MIEIFGHNSGLLDIWTIIHVGAGMMLGVIALRKDHRGFVFTLIIIGVALTIWEGFELLQGPNGVGGAESIPNQVVDILAGVAGAWLVGRFWAHSPRGP